MILFKLERASLSNMKKVLIIDDEEDLTFFVKANLEMSGDFKVLIANRAKEGIRMAAKHKPDLILLDIRIPQMDGFEILKKLKTNIKTLNIPVIMLTALSDESSKTKAAELYNEEYMVKPVKIDVLKAKIEEVLKRRGLN
ncbi:MAG: response regulator [Candidatus Omnitrophica bacterium]|nr:response regulator [Candidatus Omnitrophota bacterium]MBD3269317.1 response regulator [Candidatus Omnitrophota bacterium]